MQNVILAFTFNGIGVPAAVTGLVHPVTAMIAMAASVTTVLLNSFAGQLLPQHRVKREAVPELKTIVVKVPTIHCMGCLARIKEALGKLPAVRQVDGDITSKVVTVRVSDPDMGKEQLCAALSKIGHECS